MSTRLIVESMRLLSHFHFPNDWLCDRLRAAVLADPDHALGYLLLAMRKSRDALFCYRLLGVLLLIPDDVLESNDLMRTLFANDRLHSGSVHAGLLTSHYALGLCTRAGTGSAIGTSLFDNLSRHSVDETGGKGLGVTPDKK